MTRLHAFWNDIWPNLAASALWAPGAFAWHHRRVMRHMTHIKALLEGDSNAEKA